MPSRTYNHLVGFVVTARLAILRRASQDSGASLVEYALLLALIAMVCIAAVTLLGSSTSDGITRTADSVGAAN